MGFSRLRYWQGDKMLIYSMLFLLSHYNLFSSFQTMKRKANSSKRQMKISVKRRLKLIDLVLKKDYTIVRASKKLQLKPYTAASILNKFKEKGAVFDYKQRKYVDPQPDSLPQDLSLSNAKLEENHLSQLNLQEEKPQQQLQRPQQAVPQQVYNPWLGNVPFPNTYQPFYIIYF